MVYLSLAVVFLNYWLGGVNRGRYGNVLDSCCRGSSDRLGDHLSGYILVSLSLKINLNIFPLDCWLNIFGVIVVSCRFLYRLSSGSGSILWFSMHRSLGLTSVLLSLELNSFVVVHDLSVVDRLGYVLLSWSVDSSSVDVGLGLSGSGDRRVVDGSGLSLVHVDNLLNGLDSWLYIFLSDGKLPRNINIDRSHLGLVVYDRISSDSLGVDRSLYYFSSLYRGLDNSLSNYGLLGDGFGNYRLSYNFPGNYRFAFYPLSLGYNRLGVVRP